MKGFLLTLVVSAIGFVVLLLLLPDSMIEMSGDLVPQLAVGAFIGVINAIVKPIVKLFSLPITLMTLGLFRCHKGLRAERNLVNRGDAMNCAQMCRFDVGIQKLCDAKINDLDSAAAGHHDVRGLDIPVNDMVCMCVIECRRNGTYEWHDVGERRHAVLFGIARDPL